jgi:anti-anti-sigma factor
MAAAKKKVGKEGRNRLEVEGELTIYVAAELKEKIGALLSGDAAIEIDLAKVSEIDTAGLQLLLLAQRECAKQEKDIVFSNPSDAVLACWSKCNLNATFAVAAQ